MTERSRTSPMLRPPPRDRREALETLRLLMEQGRIRVASQGRGQ